MLIRQFIYSMLIYIALPLVRLAAVFNDKIAEGIKARKGIKKRWIEKADNLSEVKKTIWFHVASVGEYLQAKPVISLISEKLKSSVEVVLTFYSPSGMNHFDKFSLKGERDIIKFIDYLPFDTPGKMCFCLKTLEPDIIVYVHSDLWPNLIMEASKLNIPQILISGTLSPSSKRLLPLARSFYGGIYSLLYSIAAISDEDSERLKKYGNNKNIFTAGNTRIDQVWQRINNTTVKFSNILSAYGGEFIIAGSTWPEDEEVVIPGFGKLIKKYPELKLILAPHEPTPGRLSEIKTDLEREKLDFHLLSKLSLHTQVKNPVIVADGVGYLAELYRFGKIAYIGGSFTTGVHNVMEPSVFSLPVLFGPRINNSLEAVRLVSIGSGNIVKTPDEFAETVESFIEDRSLMKKAGDKASKFISANRGASEKCFEIISDAISAFDK